MGFAIQVDHREKIKAKEKFGKYIDLTRKLIIVSTLVTVPKYSEKMTGTTENKKDWENTDDIILLSDYNTKKSSRNLRQLVVTQTSVKGQYLIRKINVGDLSRGWPEGSLFDSHYTKV